MLPIPPVYGLTESEILELLKFEQTYTALYEADPANYDPPPKTPAGWVELYFSPEWR